MPRLTIRLGRGPGPEAGGPPWLSAAVEWELDAAVLRDPDALAESLLQACQLLCRAVAARPAGAAGPQHHRPPPAAPQPGRRGSAPAATRGQVDALYALARRLGLDARAEARRRFGVEHPGQLSVGQAAGLIDELRGDAAGPAGGA